MNRTRNERIALVAIAISIVVAMDAAAKEESRSVTARVVNASGSGVGIHAERQPGHFTIPEGHVATSFQYHFHDPKSNATSTRLGPSSIYSEVHGRAISEAEGNPSLRLPPGKYRFVVGGQPGAYGSLGFKIIPTTNEPTLSRTTSRNQNQPRNFDVTYNPLRDIYVIDQNGRKAIGEFEGVETQRWPSEIVVRFRDGQVTSDWESEIFGDEHLSYRLNNTLRGTLINGRFTGTEISKANIRAIYPDDPPMSWEQATVWSLDGQVDPQGLLILRGKWKSQSGQELAVRPNGQGGYTRYLKPHESHSETKAIDTELHLRLSIGLGQRTTPNAQDETTPSDDIWSTTSNETPSQAKEPRIKLIDRPRTDDLWEPDTESEIEQIATDDSMEEDRADESDDDQSDDDDSGEVRVGDRLKDGKIWYKPPWDEGGAYAMDKKDVQFIQQREAQGFRWHKRHGWVNQSDQERIEDIADIQRRNDEKEDRRSRETLEKLSDAKQQAEQHEETAKRQGDLAIMYKVKALGLESLTAKERKQLGNASEDIKNHLRGDPTNIRGYQRGVIDENFSQQTIDTTYEVLKKTKFVVDESVNLLESKTGLPGKAVGKIYTITSSVAETVSRANADYNSGMTNTVDYDTAVTDGFKEGVTNVIVDELSGAATGSLTDRGLNTKAGKQASEYVENKANQARKKATQDFLRGKTNSLNAKILDDVADAATDKAKDTINYAVGRTTKPVYDHTIKRPVENAVNWSVDTEVKPTQKPNQDDEESAEE
ncbi:hypothetical protein [Novipirellula artificiosorum]|uniref:Uncharacterized protein n=1 Tax=Novipirellula artificiosorum TaxID=2528016 RepID=A0A5C6DQX5_9BACT|nr:hypothetical protein [Novipirellula artificiosorum]TWU38277.1 hypothetical protein Poly41_27530 [Novipirellula artificiosorum]